MQLTHDHAGGACVLVVDDEEGVRDTLRDVVELTGCSVQTVANGAEALEALATLRPCLVILDLMMPIVSGHEVLAAMRRNPELATITVVITTSAPHLAPSGVPVMAKPFRIKSALDWIHRSCCCPARDAP